MSVIYVVGPPGVWKSELTKRLICVDLHLTRVDLDEAVAIRSGERPSELLTPLRGAKPFWDYSLQVLALLEAWSKKGKTYVVDVGAGALETSEGRQYFADRRAQFLCIWARPEVVYDRKHREQKRDWNHFETIEYSRHRKALYDTAAYKLDTSDQSLEE